MSGCVPDEYVRTEDLYTMPHTYTMEIDGRTLTIETGKVALQAGGSVTVQFGETVLLVTACANTTPRAGVDFFPLTVDYEEKLYSVGKIPGNFFRREGRPGTDAILAARQTDRPLRPLFPKGFRNDVQIIVTVLSADRENDPDTWATVGASAALSISNIPFDGPVSSVRVGYIDGEYVANPTFEQLGESDIDLVIAATRDAVMMVEAGANEVSEEVMLGAIRFGQEINQQIVALQDRMVADVGKPKVEFVAKQIPDEVRKDVSQYLEGKMEEIVSEVLKSGREEAAGVVKDELMERFGENYAVEDVMGAFDEVFKREIRSRILDRGVRPDGRATTEVRPITCEVGIIPRTHGSGLFTRGQTQVLSLATLGSMGDVQKLDTLSPEETKRFIHHYNFPPFSVGEVRRTGSPGRREIGHGALAERALEPVIPPVEEFPYTIRLVSEVLGSNGSTSMGSICGSTLALMDAGVPISAPVAGVAMGLVKGEGDRYVVLTDIAGIEDAMGDMDFKVGGTAAGVTALQMDIKVKGITLEIMDTALKQAYEGRMHILGKMHETIAESRPEMSRYAPRMYRLQINPDKIGAVIGPGGKTIRSIIEETKASIDIEDDGSVYIGSADEAGARRAIAIVEGLTKEVEAGQIYTGKVTRIMPFGAFVEILPNKEGLVHISELADYRVPSVEDVVQLGDEVMVMVTEIDHMGRINLSRRAVLEGAQPGDAPRPVPAGGNGGGRPPFGGRSDGGYGGRGGGRPGGRPQGQGGYGQRGNGGGRGAPPRNGPSRPPARSPQGAPDEGQPLPPPRPPYPGPKTW
jgi:polyribonucleotide nucleotidyltransferase